ncbi:hypothetical protein OAT67_08470 [Bacteriovoracaceae bacterium]|nr:hypothetical protein [Bacteriovoracaceae bacterium]
MDINSDIYKIHALKYIGREDLPEEIIPVLDCKWNDVVQFSALDPQIIVNELIKYQKDLKLNRVEYFKIHIDEVVPGPPAVIFDRDPNRGKGSFNILNKEVKYFNRNNYTELTVVPEKTIEYWKKVMSEGGKFLWFPFVTHVMIKGAVETEKFELCKLTL